MKAELREEKGREGKKGKGRRGRKHGDKCEELKKKKESDL